MPLDYVGALTIAVLCAPSFAIYASVSLDLALQLTALVAIGIQIGIGIPDLLLVVSLAVEITAGINAAISISLPSVTVDFGLSLSAQLTIVLGILVNIAALLDLLIGVEADLQAFTYVGGGAGTMGAAVDGALASGWPDGTPPGQSVSVILLAATSSGTYPSDEVASVTMLGGGKNYERGLCSVSFSGSATGTPTIASGVITGISVTGHGGAYTHQPAITIDDSTPILGATHATPIVVTIADTTDVAAVTITGVTGNTAANGSWCAKVLSGTTVALYASCPGGTFTGPAVGNGTWGTGSGTLTGSGSGAAAVAVMGGGGVAQLRGYFGGLVFPSGGISAGVSIGLDVMLPVTFALLLDLQGNLKLQAKLLANAHLNFGLVPPAISGNLSIVAGIDARAEAAAHFIPPLPSIQASLTLQIAAQISLIANLVAKIAFQLNFATETIGVYTYSGPASGLGAAIAAGLPSTSGSFVLLGATKPAAVAAMTTFFAGA